MPFRHIADPAKLRRLLEAVLLLEADLSLPVLLRHLVEEACSMTAARYGALGVLDDTHRELAEFLTVGLSAEEEAAIGHRPTGQGVLGLLISDPAPLRVADITKHPERAGFPPGHPQMRSFLGVPVMAHGEVYGNLYLTDKTGWSEFTEDDQALVEAFAQAAGIAIENARLHERVRQLAVVEDRDRIARDLHDDVIQRLFAIGLSLQAVARPPLDDAVVERLGRAIGDIDDTIRQIRSSIFELSAGDHDDAGVRAAVLQVVHELQPVVGIDVSVRFEGPVDAAVPADVVEHLLATVREALTNVGRHAQARRASLTVAVADGALAVAVEDDGRGLTGSAPTGAPGSHRGMANLRRRAEKLGGDMAVDNRPGGGTTLRWRVPVEP